jgi:hypothetical protein
MNDCWRQHNMEKHSKASYPSKRKFNEQIDKVSASSDDLKMREMYAKLKVIFILFKNSLAIKCFI